MHPYIEIEGRKIGLNFQPLIIAEIGINHNGSLSVAKKMVDAAEEAGVEFIKHQTHIVSDEMSKKARLVIPAHTKESIFEIMESCALSEDDEVELQKYVESKGLIFISTPFSRAAVDRLVRMNIPAFKIGSGECNNYPLLEYICKFRKPVILSTGMNSIESIKKAVNIFENNNIPFALLHTTNIYPTPNHLVRLGALVQLKESFPNAVIGLSDHTLTNHACFGAVALGASILERHFTDRMDRFGPDIVCSMDTKACRDLIEGSKIIFEQRGGIKEPAKEERATMDFAFATVVSIRPIAKGETFTEKNIWVKRPGTGEILAENYNQIIGKTALVDIDDDEHISWSQILK